MNQECFYQSVSAWTFGANVSTLICVPSSTVWSTGSPPRYMPSTSIRLLKRRLPPPKLMRKRSDAVRIHWQGSQHVVISFNTCFVCGVYCSGCVFSIKLNNVYGDEWIVVATESVERACSRWASASVKTRVNGYFLLLAGWWCTARLASGYLWHVLPMYW